MSSIADTIDMPDASPHFAAAVSRSANTDDAVREVCDAVLSSGAAGRPSLCFTFLSTHHAPRAAAIARAIADRLKSDAILGCTGESIVAGGEEIEEGPALALWTARMPETTVELMHLEYARTPDGGTFLGWPDALVEAVDGAWPADSSLLLLAEPFSFPADVLLEQLNEEQRHVSVIGGNASAGHAPGENRLLYRGGEVRQGAVAALVHGRVRVRPVVSQGCRPIGKPLVITKAERNIVLELGGRAPLELLKELYVTLDPRDQAMMQSGLHLGRVTNEYRESFRRGDFLIRNVIGVDGATGAIAIGDYVRAGQTVQFHLRDAQSADEDLRELLVGVRDEATENTSAAGKPLAALMFTCNGRGTRLFDAPNHDAGAIRTTLGNIPVAGFFAQGEIGPIGGRNFLHGYTASLAVFESTKSS